MVGEKLIFRHGQRTESVELEPSIFRELLNLVLAVEDAKSGFNLPITP